ncbi:MAG: peptidoglycan DD-metalloendopeptidase family protein [Oscillospiraceae bacterium]|nr:peptidoglycan DD-metalloendopeptidase family protein [Oscillospiraceae bacterium]
MKMNKFIRSITTGLITAAMIFSITPLVNTQAQGGRDFDAEIKALEEKAAKLAADNKAREGRIEDLKGDVAQQNAYIAEVNAQITAIQEQIDAYIELINAKEDAIDDMRVRIINKEKAIEKTENEIHDKELKISVLEAENEENLEKFGQIIKQMYMNSDSDTFTLLMGSIDFYDLLVRTEMIKNISDKNTEFMDDLLEAIKRQEDAIEELEQDKAQLHIEKNDLETHKKNYEFELLQLETAMEAITEEINRQYAELYKLAANRDELNKNINNLRQAISASNAEVEAINQAVEELIKEKQRAANRHNYSADGFIWPLDSQFRMITCRFGWDAWRGGMHYGVDIGNAGIGGAPIYAMQSGTVLKSFNNGAWNGGYGNYVIIDHGGGVATLYAHASSVTVVELQEVTQGQIIGYVGRTGWSTGNHLHFEVRIDGKAVNPLDYL